MAKSGRTAVLGRIPHAFFPEEVILHESGTNVYGILQALWVRWCKWKILSKAFAKLSLPIP